MSSERKYMLIVVVLTLIASGLIGVTIALATGDIERGARVAGLVIAGSMFWSVVLWLAGRAQR